MIFRIQVLGVVCLLLGVSGCGGKASEAPPPPVAPPPAVSAPPVTSEVAPPVNSAEPATPSAAMSDAKEAPTGSPATTAPGPDSAGKDEAEAKSAETPVRVADPAFMERIRKAVAAAGPVDDSSALKKIGLAMHRFAEEHDLHFPTVDGMGIANTPTGLSWRVILLPYLGQQELYSQFHLDEAWDSPHNKELISQMPAVFGENEQGKTHLHLFTGPKTPFQPGAGPPLRDFTDGLSNTILVVAAGAETADIWTKPGGLKFDPKNPSGALEDVGDRFLAVLADGSVRVFPVNAEYLSDLIRYQDARGIPHDVETETRYAPNAPMASTTAADVELPPLQTPAEQFDPRYIPADATGAIILSPRRILENSFVQLLLKQFAVMDETPWQTLRRLTKTNGSLSLPLETIEEIRIVPNPALKLTPELKSGSPQAAADAAAIYVRSAIPLPVEVLIQQAAQAAESVEVEEAAGVPYIHLGGLFSSIAFLNEREMAAGSLNTIHLMLDATPADAEKSQVVAALTAMKPSMIMMAAHAPEGSKLDFMQQVLSAAGPAALLMPQLAETNAILLSLDLEAPEFLRLSLGFSKEDLARTFTDVARGLLAQGQLQGKQYQAGLKQDDPAQKAQADLLNDVMTGAEILTDGTLVSLAIKHPEHLEQALTAFQSQIAAVQMQSIPPEALPPLERISKAMMDYQEEHGHLPAANGTGAEEIKTRGTKFTRGDRREKGNRGNKGDKEEKEEKPAEPFAGSDFQAPPGGFQPPGTNPQQAPGEEKFTPAMLKNKGLSWRVYLLPQLGENQLYEQFNLEERWDSPHNKALVAQMPAVFGENPDGKTRIHMIVGNDTLFKGGKAPDLEELRDDPAYTIALIETGTDKADFWTKPGGLPFDARNPTRCLGKPDKDQTDFQTIMLDWSLTTIPVDIDDVKFRSLVQPSDGKPARKE